MVRMSKVTTTTSVVKIGEIMSSPITKYTAIFEDGFVQNSAWVEKCALLCEDKNCVVGIRGGILNPHSLNIELPVNQPKYDHEVDYVSRAWLFKTEWIHHTWQDASETIDPISFCACCLVEGNIPSFVVDASNRKQTIDSEWRPKTSEKREKTIEFCLSKGWKLLSERSQEVL